MRALIAAVMPAAGDRIDRFEPYLEAACTRFGIGSDLALAMFLAQVAHESGELRYVREIASGAAYEGRADLGNTQPGDGPMFRGRGLIQITGRDNYRRCGAALGLDLLMQPELLEEPRWAALSAGWFWSANGLTALAEGPSPLERCTRRINGGLNGLEQRRRYYERALAALAAPAPAEAASEFVAEAPTPQQIAASPQSIPVEAEPMDPFTATALGALVREIPELIRSFGSEGRVTERNAKAAELLINSVQAATGTQNAQAAVEAVRASPEIRQQVAQRLEAEGWFEVTEAGGGGIAGAREFNTLVASVPPSKMPAMWITLAILPLVYAVVLAVLFVPGFSDEMKGTVIGVVLTGALGAIIAFWLGSSFGSNEKNRLIASRQL